MFLLKKKIQVRKTARRPALGQVSLAQDVKRAGAAAAVAVGGGA